ncbi:TPA: hypothetical protein ACK2XJ_005066, partial [Klebsiella oxytoca]
MSKTTQKKYVNLNNFEPTFCLLFTLGGMRGDACCRLYHFYLKSPDDIFTLDTRLTSLLFMLLYSLLL